MMCSFFHGLDGRSRLDWAQDGRDWPNRAHSRFVDAAGLRWHVQVMGEGPVVLLVHGTGAATHSWAELAPLLAEHFTVVAPDLPGHGFTEEPSPAGLSLPGMAKALSGLLAALEMPPALAVGHSAGAAVLARMCLDGDIAPKALISLNGALLPMQGVSGAVFSPVARVLACTPMVTRLFAWRARDPEVLERLLRGTGSRIDRRGKALYARLARSPAHVAAALGMMASWDLDPLVRDLPRLAPRLVLVAGAHDKMIPPSHALRVRSMVPGAVVEQLPVLGHLAHEEAPQAVHDLIRRHAEAVGVLAAQ